MSGRGLLDADMATIGRWLRNAFDWWLDELAEMCPPVLLQQLRRRWPRIVWRDGKLLTDREGPLPRRADVVLPAEAGLVRWTALPPMGRRDLVAAVAFEAERLMPLPAAEMLIAVGDGQVSADAPGRKAVAGISRIWLSEVLEQLAAAGCAPESLVLEAEGQRFDFSESARAAGLTERGASPALAWWGVVALLAALNAGVMIRNDMDSLAQLQAQIDARQPIAMAAQRAARRLQTGLLVARDETARRQHHDPLGAMARVSAALPDQAWVQKWSWDADTVRIAGYARGPVDVVKALRDSHRFGDVRNVSPDQQGEIPVGRPFDVRITP